MQLIENNIYHNYGQKSLSAKIFRSLLVPILVLIATGTALFLQNTELAFILEGFLKINVLTYIVSGGVMVALILGLVQILVGWLQYKNTLFMLSDNALYIRTGILERNEISIPLRHIQNIIQRQGILDRMLQVCSCEIEIEDDEVSTSSGAYSSRDIILRDVDIKLVTPLREAILSRANTQRMVVVNR